MSEDTRDTCDVEVAEQIEVAEEAAPEPVIRTLDISGGFVDTKGNPVMMVKQDGEVTEQPFTKAYALRRSMDTLANGVWDSNYETMRPIYGRLLEIENGADATLEIDEQWFMIIISEGLRSSQLDSYLYVQLRDLLGELEA